MRAAALAASNAAARMREMRFSWIVPVVLAGACGGSETRAVSPAATPIAPTTSRAPAPVAAPSGPPVAERRIATDTYHGMKVDDAYRWLESDDAAVKAWRDGQNRHTR